MRKQSSTTVTLASTIGLVDIIKRTGGYRRQSLYELADFVSS